MISSPHDLMVTNYMNVRHGLAANFIKDKVNDFVIVVWDGDEVCLERYSFESDEWHEITLDRLAEVTKIPLDVIKDYCVVDLWINNHQTMLFGEFVVHQSYIFELYREEGCRLTDKKGEVIAFIDYKSFVNAFASMPQEQWTFDACHKILNDFSDEPEV